MTSLPSRSESPYRLEDLTPAQRAELGHIPLADLRAELESCALDYTELELRVATTEGDAEQVELAAWGLMIEKRGVLIKLELQRRQRLGALLPGPTYSREWLHELKNRIDLPELIVSMHAGTGLKRSGTHFVGLCPYHVEQTGSLCVWPDHYHCYGCGEHGDVFDWLMKMAVPTWRDAVEYAARYAGVPLPVGQNPFSVSRGRGGIQV